MSVQERIVLLFSLRALDVLIDEKYIIQEDYDRGYITYEEYYSCSSVIQDKIDCISPIDISFI